MLILSKVKTYKIVKYVLDRIQEQTGEDFTSELEADLMFYAKPDPYHQEATDSVAICRWDPEDLVKMILEDQYDYHLDPEMLEEISKTILVSLRKNDDETKGDIQEFELVNFIKGVMEWQRKYLS